MHFDCLCSVPSEVNALNLIYHNAEVQTYSLIPTNTDNSMLGKKGKTINSNKHFNVEMRYTLKEVHKNKIRNASRSNPLVISQLMIIFLF